MFYEEGTDVIIETTPPSANSGERYLLSWEADGIGMDDVPPSPATPNPYSYTVLSPATVNANWVKQVQLTISDPMGAGVNMIPPIGSSWHFVGDEVAGRVDFLYQGIVCTGYTGTGSAPGSTAPLFRFDITQPSEVTWNFELRDTSNIPAPLWNEPFTLATNAFGTGCSLAWSSANSPFVAYTGAPAENQKADGKTEPDSIRVGWVFNGQWRIDVIDSGGQFGQKVNIALDSNDLPWVVYIKDSEAMVAHFDGTEWFSQIVTSSYAATNYIDIAIDEYDTAHIAFYGSSIGALIYAQPDGLIWATEEVDDVGNVGLYCSIEVMPILNWPSISYYDSTNRAVKFARLENDVWNIYGVDTNGDVGRNGNLALDPSGVPYICYQVMTEPADMGLRIAWLRPEGWQNIDLSTNSITGYDISIDIDSHGIIHVTYRDFDTLRYAWYNGVTWGVDYDVAGTQANGMTNVALDSSGNPSIVFWDGADLKFVDTAAGDYTGPIGTDETRLDTAGGGGGGGCFVATAAFGSYASDSVTALTGVRDSGIRASNSGSSLVALYYAVSPAPAGSLANSAASRALFRELLR
ncbi:MAG: CFI-box-CTERM domain-containing protein [Planctomycetota bacterium]|nr:CFI-box-CTERM domain-containing protein [Planctomycetota bacterium]